jgi:peptidoglycan DL-endopeptidase CwlO
MSMMRVASVLLAWGLVGCATGRPLGARTLEHGYRPFGANPSAIAIPAVGGPGVALEVAAGARTQVVQAARHLVGRQRVELAGRRFGDDCTGLVRGVYSTLGVDLMTAAAPQDNGVTAIWRFAAQHGRIYEGGRPVPGDLVFFRETYDLNRDGVINDGLTHIGLVDEVEPDGTVLVIHRVAKGVVRYHMNLSTPSRARDDRGKVVNDGLRPGRLGAPTRLTGELFVGYATLLPIERPLAGKE